MTAGRILRVLAIANLAVLAADLLYNLAAIFH